MIRNEYRRALIMLRGLDKGVTGHVRLERRTLMGTMQFTVSGAAASETLHAALLSKQNGRWIGAKLGTLGRDGRGQAELNASFDPRNIEGYELEQYALIIIVGAADDRYRLLMSGYVNGVVDVDWAQIHDAAKALYQAAPASSSDTVAMEAAYSVDAAAAEPVTALPDVDCCCENEAGAVELEESAKEANTESAAAEATDAAETDCCCEEKEPIYEREDTLEEATEAEPVEEPAPVTLSAVTLDEVAAMPDGQKEEIAQKMPAGLLLDLDITEKWPSAIEALRTIFLQETEITPFDDPGYVFVRAPLPGAADVSHCAVGIRCENKRPAAVCYAIPGSFQPDNPAGMEGYQWLGADNEGWWVIHVDAETGEQIE